MQSFRTGTERRKFRPVIFIDFLVQPYLNFEENYEDDDESAVSEFRDKICSCLSCPDVLGDTFQCATALLKAASRSAMFKKETFPTEFSTSAYYLMRSALFPTVGNKNSYKNVKNIPCKGQGLNSTSFARGGKIKALIVLAIRVSVYVAIEI